MAADPYRRVRAEMLMATQDHLETATAVIDLRARIAELEAGRDDAQRLIDRALERLAYTAASTLRSDLDILLWQMRTSLADRLPLEDTDDEGGRP